MERCGKQIISVAQKTVLHWVVSREGFLLCFAVFCLAFLSAFSSFSFLPLIPLSFACALTRGREMDQFLKEAKKENQNDQKERIHPKRKYSRIIHLISIWLQSCLLMDFGDLSTWMRGKEMKENERTRNEWTCKEMNGKDMNKRN